MSEFFPVTKVDGMYTRKYSGSWYIVNLTPLTNKDELNQVISDLLRQKTVSISPRGQVLHYTNCDSISHQLPKKIKDVLDEIHYSVENTSFKIVIRSPYFRYVKGYPQKAFSGQYLVFGIDPVISFSVFPDHPHLNGYELNTIPASICYTDDYEVFNNEKNIIDYVVEQTSIWLLKHLVWNQLNKIKYSMPWIGPASDELANSKRFSLNNPNSICICGSNKLYKDCCLKKHFEFETKRKFTPSDLSLLQNNWYQHEDFEQKFREDFIRIFDVYN